MGSGFTTAQSFGQETNAYHSIFSRLNRSCGNWKLNPAVGQRVEIDRTKSTVTA